MMVRASSLPIWLTLCVLSTAACGDRIRGERGVHTANDVTWHDDWYAYDGGELRIEPDPIVFEVEEIGVPVFAEVVLRNVGHEGLVILDTEATGGRARETSMLGASLPLGLAANEERTVTLVYEPESCDPSQASFSVIWTDLETPHTSVGLQTTGLIGELSVTPDRIDFGRLGADAEATRAVEVSNDGRCPLHVDELAIEGSAHFSMVSLDGTGREFRPEYPLVVTDAEPLRFGVRYRSDEDVPESATLFIDAREEPEKWPVPLTANQRECPIADARAWILELGEDSIADELSAIPLQNLVLDASQSVDPDGEIVGYEWRLLERPRGSNAVLEPNATAESPTFFLDLAGMYRFELVVFDNDGLPSCTPDRLDVTVVPDEDVHVQLVWHTPGDENEGNGAGTDLDLHLLRRPGNWDTEPWDCHWRNMEPDWGERGPLGDPSLDIDDVNELGPENINLDEPEEGRVYGIGVYYYDDVDMGSSYATLRVFIDGVLVYEAEDKEVRSEGVFWEVGNVAWPSAELEEIDNIYNFGFP